METMSTSSKVQHFFRSPQCYTPTHESHSNIDEQKCNTKLLVHNFELHHKPGKENKVVDDLRHIDHDVMLTVSTNIAAWLNDICKHLGDGLESRKIINNIREPKCNFGFCGRLV